MGNKKPDSLRLMVGCCNNQKISTLSSHKDNIHYFCNNCRSHYYKGRLWSKKEWSNYIEEGVK